MKNNYRVSRGFGQLTITQLDTFGENVVTGLENNPAFPTPMVPVTELKDKLLAYRQAVTAAANGGKVEIAIRNAAQDTLLAALRQEAAYVESVAGDDLPTLLSSGFQSVNTNRTQIPLPKPVVERVDNPGTTQLALRLQSVPTARAYEVRISYGDSGWQGAGVFTKARLILLENLTPGTTYTIQVRAIGGSTGSSDWSDPSSHMAL
ncbi:MAG: hypothetical protein ACTHLW_03335 [Verrucomicrobiota bacterium]